MDSPETEKSKTKSVLSFILFALLFAWLLVLTVLFFRANHALEQTQKEFGVYQTNNAGANRYENVIADIAAKKVYVYEAKLALPLSDTTKSIAYDKRDSDMYFTTTNMLGRLLPEGDAPSCAKIARLSQEKTDAPEMQYVGEISTAPNGYKYIYQHSPCKIFSSETQSEIVNALKAATVF